MLLPSRSSNRGAHHRTAPLHAVRAALHPVHLRQEASAAAAARTARLFGSPVAHPRGAAVLQGAPHSSVQGLALGQHTSTPPGGLQRGSAVLASLTSPGGWAMEPCLTPLILFTTGMRLPCHGALHLLAAPLQARAAAWAPRRAAPSTFQLASGPRQTARPSGPGKVGRSTNTGALLAPVPVGRRPRRGPVLLCASLEVVPPHPASNSSAPPSRAPCAGALGSSGCPGGSSSQGPSKSRSARRALAVDLGDHQPLSQHPGAQAWAASTPARSLSSPRPLTADGTPDPKLSQGVWGCVESYWRPHTWALTPVDACGRGERSKGRMAWETRPVALMCGV